MSDIGTKFADKRIRYVDSRISTEYRQAEKELNEKLADFVRKSAERDRIKRKQRDEGIISEQDYKDWLAGQVFIRKRWESKVKQASEVLHTHNLQANKIIHENAMDVFRENYNYSAFTAEMGTGVSFDLINEQAVINLAKKNPQLLPEWKIDEEKDYKWNYRKANNSVMQGIIQGESVDKIAKRMAKNLCTQNKNKMRLFARTAITGAQNGGRQAQMEAAEEDGIEQKKEWVATLDGRTRDSHRRLDGQQVGVNESFDGEFGKIMFPGDPTAHPAEVYNCRCAMITVYPKYAGFVGKTPRRAKSEYTDKDGNKRSFSYLTQDPEMYEKWKNEKAKKQSSRDAEEPKRKSEEIKTNPMSEEEYDKWQKENATRAEIAKKFEEEYGVSLSDALMGRADRYLESGKWLYEVAQETNDDFYQVESGYGHCGYIQAAEGSKAINAYLRRGEVGMYKPAEMQKTIDAMDRLISVSKLDRQMAVDRCAGIDALERMGVPCGEHGATGRIGHAFCTDGLDVASIVKSINSDFVGTVIIDDGFMSASAVPEKNIFGGSDVTFTVIAPKGTNAFITDNTRESEIIFEHGTQQEIVGARASKREVTDWEGNKQTRETVEVFVRIIGK